MSYIFPYPLSQAYQGRGFGVGTNIVPVSGDYSFGQIYNPTGSGKILIVHSIKYANMTSSANFSVRTGFALQSGTSWTPLNLDVGNAATSVASVVSGALATVGGTNMLLAYVGTTPYEFLPNDEGIVVEQGQTVTFQAGATGQNLVGQMVWSEVTR
jgi:hypothetical protein